MLLLLLLLSLPLDCKEVYLLFLAAALADDESCEEEKEEEKEEEEETAKPCISVDWNKTSSAIISNTVSRMT